MTLEPDDGQMQGEIGYDRMTADQMSFAVGTYRIGSGEWKGVLDEPPASPDRCRPSRHLPVVNLWFLLVQWGSRRVAPARAG